MTDSMTRQLKHSKLAKVSLQTQLAWSPLCMFFIILLFPYYQYQIFLGGLGERLPQILNCTCNFGGKSPRPSFGTVAQSVYLAAKYFKLWHFRAKTGAVQNLKDFLKKQESIPLFPPGRIILIQERKIQRYI